MNKLYFKDIVVIAYFIIVMTTIGFAGLMLYTLIWLLIVPPFIAADILDGLFDERKYR